MIKDIAINIKIYLNLYMVHLKSYKIKLFLDILCFNENNKQFFFSPYYINQEFSGFK